MRQLLGKCLAIASLFSDNKERNEAYMNFQDIIQEETLLAAIAKLNWKQPTEIQQQVIPLLKNKQNIVMQADTGSGKTGAYGLGILEQLKWENKTAQCLIIAPTRELALQIKNDIEHIGKYKRIKCTALIGKEPMEQQLHDLKQKHHVISGTPGRILDHIQQGNINLSSITHIVVDEVDELCAMGFYDTLCAILDAIVQPCCMCFCSATIDDAVCGLAERYTENYETISHCEEKLKKQFQNEVYQVSEADKPAFLWKLLLYQADSTTIIFCNTRDTCESVYRNIRKHMQEVAIYHGALDQQKRRQELEKLYSGQAQIMVASDIAARGLDIDKVDTIINYDLPNDAVRFQHRAGRSGRGNRSGHVITLADASQTDLLKQFQEALDCEFIRCAVDLINAQSDDPESLAKLLSKRQLKSGKAAAFHTDILRLYIHGGKKKKIRAKDLVGAICQIDTISFADIGVIEIQGNGSYVEILNHKGMQVYEQLKTLPIKNRHLKVEISHKQYE